ncbi:MAG: quinone-dependent dihydroorotate dehydrogenase [Candidatus Liptonbacteria bacterium]|nr:quinone-dependent dihydroorotate dehydrogenase [Candidatus Liptonbacteria bacterium]
MGSLYENILRPLLFRLSSRDPEIAHEWALKSLRLLGQRTFLRRMIERRYVTRDPRLKRKVFGVEFPNPVGLAAGFDKNGQVLRGLAALGFGFIELGTITRHAQPGNPRPRMFRLPEDQALINRMGFNNEGADVVAARLRRMRKLPIPLGISIGKSKITPQEDAAEDYAYSFRTLYLYADYIAVNVSSPNTPGLRELQSEKHLDQILTRLRREANELQTTEAKQKPILVKVAPELDMKAIDAILEVCRTHNIAGIIAANTSTTRPNLKGYTPEAGGLSGKPLFTKACEIICHIRARAPKFAIIGTGGVFSAEDARQMLGAGADLVELYTGFIYKGPGLIKEINKGLIPKTEEENTLSR